MAMGSLVESDTILNLFKSYFSELFISLITLLKLSPLFIINYIIHSIHNRIFSRSFNLFISATFRTVLLSVFSAALQLVMLTHHASTLQVVVPPRGRTVKLSETLRK